MALILQIVIGGCVLGLIIILCKGLCRNSLGNGKKKFFFSFSPRRQRDVCSKWLSEQKEREKKYQQNGEMFKSFHYIGESPFEFDSDTYVYIENSYNKNLNYCIENNLNKIIKIFSQYGFRFLYLPRWQPDTSLNCRANLTEVENKRIETFLSSVNTVEYTILLCKALQIDIKEIECGIFHFACFLYNDQDYCHIKPVRTKFTLFPMQRVTEDTIEDFCLEYCELIKESRRRHSPFGGPCMSVVSKLKGGEFYERRGDPQQNFADHEFPIVMKNIADNIKKEIKTLRDAGYYELLLHTLGADTLNELRNVKLNPALSRLQITDDFKIRLLDYDKEVRMTPLQKTLYIFYLRHPEGVEFKMLSAYYNELLAIYKVLSNREDDQKQRESIDRLVDVTDNAINEKCSRVKEAFLKVTDDFIAKNYYIVLKESEYRGEGENRNYIYIDLLKKIMLPRELVIYPGEIDRIEVLASEAKKKVIKDNLEKVKTQYRELERLFFDKSYSKGKLLEQYTKFINDNPKYYAAYCDRAILNTHVGRYHSAIADNQLLINHNERVWSIAVINKAEALFFLEDYREALKVANYYFEIEEKPTAECYRIRAEILKRLKMDNAYEVDMKAHKCLLKEEKRRPQRD